MNDPGSKENKNGKEKKQELAPWSFCTAEGNLNGTVILQPCNLSIPQNIKCGGYCVTPIALLDIYRGETKCEHMHTDVPSSIVLNRVEEENNQHAYQL